MKKLQFFTFIFLIIFSKYGYSTEIKQTTFAFWDKPDVELFYLSPQNINKNTEVLFVIHGNSRNAKGYLKKWIPLIENKNIIVEEDYLCLSEAYIFLRHLENRVQITFGLQTHQLPENDADRVVLAKKMRIEGKTMEELLVNLMKVYESHTSFVGNIFSKQFAEKEKREAAEKISWEWEQSRNNSFTSFGPSARNKPA